MRLSVASTGGSTGSGSAGAAARFSAVYSFTGSTTQPSGVVAALWAKLETAKTNGESRASARRDAGKRNRFMVILLLKFVCSVADTRRDKTARLPPKNHPHFGSIRDPGEISL